VIDVATAASPEDRDGVGAQHLLHFLADEVVPTPAPLTQATNAARFPAVTIAMSSSLTRTTILLGSP
jgi:hypothetical protein